jgi:uncharacterized protein YndB with AHSA1/START domain
MPLIQRSIRTANNRVLHVWSIAVPSNRLWWGLTDSEALPRWLGKLSAGSFVTGHVIRIEHAEDYTCTSRIQECEPGRRLAMTWEFPDEPLSTVLITLSPEPNATRLTLTHDGLGDEAPNYLTGWHTHLLYLEALLLCMPRSMADFWSTYDELAASPAISPQNGRTEARENPSIPDRDTELQGTTAPGFNRADGLDL